MYIYIYISLLSKVVYSLCEFLSIQEGQASIDMVFINFRIFIGTGPYGLLSIAVSFEKKTCGSDKHNRYMRRVKLTIAFFLLVLADTGEMAEEDEPLSCLLSVTWSMLASLVAAILLRVSSGRYCPSNCPFAV